MTLRSSTTSLRSENLSVQPLPAYSQQSVTEPVTPNSYPSGSEGSSPVPSSVDGNVQLSCVPSQRWVACFVNAPVESIPLAKVIFTPFEPNKYSWLYHVCICLFNYVRKFDEVENGSYFMRIEYQ